jgi:hypothetical protein
MDIEKANQTAVDNLMNARPILKSVATARDVIPGMKDNLFLHAGPPIEWERMSQTRVDVRESVVKNKPRAYRFKAAAKGLKCSLALMPRDDNLSPQALEQMRRSSRKPTSTVN